MSVSLTELGQYLEQAMNSDLYRDYCPNGLQVEGRPQVSRIATGVTACQALLDEAIAWGADAILVHHGYFWRDENPQVVGMKRRRLATLLGNEVSLFAYHLPLDGHPEFGNNARFGELLGLPLDRHEPLEPGVAGSVGNIGTLAEAMSSGELVAALEKEIGRGALHIGDPGVSVSRIAWCTGGAQSYIDKALAAGADLFVTGEVSEQTVHVAREEGVQFVAAGHHATERYGVQALGAHLAERFSVEHRFFDIDNPV